MMATVATARFFEEGWRENVSSQNWGGRLSVGGLKLPYPCAKLVKHMLQFHLDLRCQCPPAQLSVKKRKGESGLAIPAPRKWAHQCSECNWQLRNSIAHKIAAVKEAIQGRVHRNPTTTFMLPPPQLTADTSYMCMDITIWLFQAVHVADSALDKPPAA